METDGDQNQGSTNGTTPSGVNSRPSQMNSMSLYERQAVQALQALQRQPNAAQYFQQLMLQQQINSAQLQNLAAVQQATLAASRQSSPSTNSTSQTTSTSVTSVNVTTSGGGAITTTRTIGPGSSATSTISQSVLLGGSTAGQGQMYLRVNRSLRSPLSSQLIFMPSSTATAAVATVTQQPQTPHQQQQQEVPPTSSSNQSDIDQVQNLALRGVSNPKAVGVKAEVSDRATYSLIQSSPQQFHQSTPQSPIKPNQLQQPHIKIPTYTQSSNASLSSLNLKTSNHQSNHPSSPSTSIPLSQLLLSGPKFGRGGAVTTAASASAATHILVPTSSAPAHGRGYQMGGATIKTNGSAQTLVVQPLQKSAVSANDKGGQGNGPVPIQPKTQQSLRMPLQLPSRNPPPILPAPPASTAQPPPHIPVQIVGARQSSVGNPQALALVHARNACSHEGATILSSSSSASLLTMVASIASREGGVIGRGASLKSLQSAQEPLPLAHISHVQVQANQSPAVNPSPNCSLATSASSQPRAVSSPPALSRSTLALPLPSVEASSTSAAVVTNGESTCPQPPESMKRKSDSSAADDEDGPPPPHLVPVRENSPVLSSPAVEAGPGPLSPSPSPAPTPSATLPLTRIVSGHGERAPPPQAVVKPHVLTHLIEGFVIHEGAEPFPVIGPVKDATDMAAENPDASRPQTVNVATVLKCEYCKSFAPARQFRGTKRFCSLTCSKRYNVSCSQHFRLRQGGHLSHSDQDGVLRRSVPRRTSSQIASAKIAGRPLPAKCRSESSRSDDVSSCEEDDEEEDEEEDDDPMSLSPASSSCHQRPPTLRLESSASPHFLPGSPTRWSVEEVSNFISSLQGCEELAAQFLSQEIDGQALLLLREEHLMSAMNIKLGPALKICAHINTLRD
ncbi:polyhomeotic-like protein 1 [Esox lucius]|uniref:Polyhomeotic homolog 1 n=1 Tax=Esox lucius TaxID=8010 RepID=A0A3P8Z4B8_ESOLU|nr:polyhomeotic-like protein 1 [Esox lucius]XP_010895182.1 polyhomeotic-like protein 1 [Esox lucius]